MERLSSKYLYNYKSKIDVIKLILKNGFRHNMWEENVIFRNSKQQNFIVCFSDILKQHSDYHQKCYGGNAVVLMKDWGIKNGVSPVRYIHKNSIGIYEDYIKMKNINREIRDKNIAPENSYQFAYDYLAFSLAKDLGHLSRTSIEGSRNVNPALDDFMKEFDSEFDKLELFLKGNNSLQLFQKYINSIGNRIIELHNELEKRDAFLRIYQDDFSCPTGTVITNKILYDEREWRSIKYINSDDFKKNPSEYYDAISKGYLPERYNLLFDSNDFVALLVSNTIVKTELQNFLENEITLLSKVDINKIKLFKDFVDE